MLIIASLISACCTPSITASKGFILRFTDSTVIQSVELIEANRSIHVGAPSVFLTLNPADTISTYRIFYEGGSGLLTLTYSGKLRFIGEDCGNEYDLDVNYEIRSIRTSFLDAYQPVSLFDGSSDEIYITR